MSQKSFKLVLALSVCTLALAACKTTQTAPPQADNASKIDSALERAANNAAAQGNKNQSMGYLEQLYKRNSSDPQAAIDYAAKLRENDSLDQAELILAPFANDPKSPAAAKTEYAAIQLALGQDKLAEKYAQKAILQDTQDAKAYHYLGIALDAQMKHPEAERAYRKGLDYWTGDPVPIMNNLALNLASQNFLDEALEILHKAKAIAPDRIEVERNLRIVTALKQSSSGYEAPKPHVKPKPAPAAASKPAQETPAEPVNN